jgi:hypothetical protein
MSDSPPPPEVEAAMKEMECLENELRKLKIVVSGWERETARAKRLAAKKRFEEALPGVVDAIVKRFPLCIQPVLDHTRCDPRANCMSGFGCTGRQVGESVTVSDGEEKGATIDLYSLLDTAYDVRRSGSVRSEHMPLFIAVLALPIDGLAFEAALPMLLKAVHERVRESASG